MSRYLTKTAPNGLAVPGCSESQTAPKGLGWPRYKPLMRNARGNDYALPGRYTAGNTLLAKIEDCLWMKGTGRNEHPAAPQTAAGLAYKPTLLSPWTIRWSVTLSELLSLWAKRIF